MNICIDLHMILQITSSFNTDLLSNYPFYTPSPELFFKLTPQTGMEIAIESYA